MLVACWIWSWCSHFAVGGEVLCSLYRGHDRVVVQGELAIQSVSQSYLEQFGNRDQLAALYFRKPQHVTLPASLGS